MPMVYAMIERTKAVHQIKMRGGDSKRMIKTVSRQAKNAYSILAVLVAMCCIFLLSACSSASSSSDSSATSSNYKKIAIGCDSYPPANYTDESGNPAGFDVEISREAFRRIGYKPEFKYINWEDKNSLLATGEIDCIMGCFSMTGREGEYTWAGPYMKSRQVIAVNESSDIKTLADLKDKVVAVQATTKPESIFLSGANKKVPEIKDLYAFSNKDSLYPALLKGYVDAIGAHELSVLEYEKEYGASFRVLDESLLDVELGVAFQKGNNKNLAKRLTSALNEMTSDGTMEKILSGYFSNPSDYVLGSSNG